MPRLGPFALLVSDYDEAIDWFTRVLGFRLVEDDDQGHKRWVVVEGDGGGSLVLARAKNDSERARIGDQHGGRIGFFLEVDEFDEAHRRMNELGVQFEEQPRHEAYGKIAVFRDLYGNRWDLVEPTPSD
jgi:catechol 2,3-dioxygenase-like lactoylglutathione lyase family enzyme